MKPGFAYTQARIQAHYALLADEPVWQGLEAARSLSGYLEEVRRTSMAPRVSGLSLMSDAHQVERQLLHVLHGLLRQAARWTPEPWRPAVQWLAWLPELPLLERLIQGTLDRTNTPSSTLLDLPREPSPAALPRILAAAGGEALLPDPEDTPITGRWHARWRGLWPGCMHSGRAGMERLSALVGEHQAGFGAVPPGEAWEARRRLGQQLHCLFRRHALRPAALFSWLGLELLALERLRGALVIRACFEGGRP